MFPRAASINVQGNTSNTNVSNSTIHLPRDFHPISALQAVESLHSFLGKTFHNGAAEEAVQTVDGDHKPVSKYKLQIVALKRLREMQVSSNTNVMLQ